MQGDDLLIEYDNTTDDGNHAHTVLRRPPATSAATCSPPTTPALTAEDQVVQARWMMTGLLRALALS